MSEKETEKQEESQESNEGRNQSEGTSLVERADAAAKRLEEANKKAEEINRKREDLMAMGKLGGSIDSGQQPPKQEEESPQDYAQRALEGKIESK